MDQALNSQKTPHTSPLRASYGMSFVSILMKNDRVIKGFYCSIPQRFAEGFKPMGAVPHTFRENIGLASGINTAVLVKIS